jgi:hypothetical protein
MTTNHNLSTILNMCGEPFVMYSVGVNPKVLSRAVSNAAGGIKTAFLEGTRMCNWRGFYSEFILKFGLPEYFGENLDALDEVLRDLSWISAPGFALTILNADQVLINETRRLDLVNYGRFLGVFWMNPGPSVHYLDGRCVPFHTLLHFESDPGFSKEVYRLEW